MYFDKTKETMYLVTDIEFDVTHGGEAFDDLWTDEGAP